MPKITIDLLSPGSLDAAIRQIDDYKRSLKSKCESLAERVAERIAWRASEGFSTAIADDIFSPAGDRPTGNVSVSVSSEGALCVVIAEGEDAAFIEFGAGVSYNGPVGSSPNPLVAQEGLPFTIGSHSYVEPTSKTRWWFTKDGQHYGTHGTPAAMPMYRGVQDAINVIADLAREVFGR